MIFMFTTSNMPASKLIRWGLNEPASHFAIMFNNGIVCHQSFTGFTIDWYPHWKKRNVIVKRLTPHRQTIGGDRDLMTLLATKFAGKKYDYLGFLYFSWRAFLRKFFRLPLPPINRLGDDPSVLCTGLGKEIANQLPKYFSYDTRDFDIITPYQLYENMVNSGAFIQSPKSV